MFGNFYTLNFYAYQINYSHCLAMGLFFILNTLIKMKQIVYIYISGEDLDFLIMAKIELARF